MITPDFEIYSEGTIHISVCSSLSPEEIVDRANRDYPSGVTSNWQLSEDKLFASGQPNPCPCEQHPETHKHYLLNC